MGRHAFTQKFLPLALAAAMALPAVPAMAATNDISGHWAEKVMAEWQEKGLIKGYNDGTLKPNNSITRAEFVTLLNNAKGITAEKSISFTDVTASDWFYAAVAKAAGYTKGYDDNTFRPNQTITRAEAAIMLANVAGLAANESGADGFTDAIPTWAKGSIGAVAAAGFMSGYPDGSFGASANITRAEAVSCLNRMLNGAEETTEPSKDEDVVIEKAGTVLENETVAGNVTIAASVGEGNVTLKNVEIKGDLIVKGGGANSITLNATKIAGKVILQKENVHLHLIGDTKIPNVEMKAPARITKGSSFKGEIDTLTIALEKSSKKDIRIEAPVDRMTLESEASLILNANVNRLTVDADAKNSEIEIKDGATVNTLNADAKVTLTGTGKINQLNAAASGITLDNSLSVKKTVTDTGVKEPTTTGGSSGGGGSKTPTTPAVEVKAIGKVADIEVATGTLTDADKAIAALPKQVVMMDSEGISIKVNGENVLADVEWTFTGCTIMNNGNLIAITTGFKGTLDTGETRCVNTFIGKVTIPSGYTFTGNANALTITTTITVKQTGEVTLNTIDAAAIADIANQESYVSEGKIVEVLREKNLLPTKLSLYCGTQFVTTVNIPEGTKWTAQGGGTHSKDGYEKYDLTPTLDWTEIEKQVPAGYQLKKNGNNVDLSANCSVYVKKLDFSALNAKIAELEALKNQLAINEEDAIQNNKIFLTSEDKTPADVTKGLSFIVDKDYTSYNAFQKTIADAKDYPNSKTFDTQQEYDEQQQKLLDNLQAEFNDFSAFLENAKQIGTKLPDAYVVELVQKELQSTQYSNNAPYSVTKQPLKPYSMTKTTYSLCESMDITDGNSTISANLTWEYDATYLENVDGNDYSIKVKDNAPTTPTEVTFTAKLTEYSVDGGTAVSVTNGKVGEYTATIAAPLKLRVDTSSTAALTSGVDGTATIVVPTNGLATINENPTDSIKIEETTSGENKLLNNLVLSSVSSNNSGIALAINAKPTQLSAVLASDTPKEGTDYETATVKFTIPASALTLTDAGKQAGWYIPNDDLTLTANVKVWHPLITITKLATSEKNVKVKFDAKYFSENYYPTVWMALVQGSPDTFPSGNTSYVKSTYGEGVNGNGINYSVDISTSSLTAGTYSVWVSIGDDGDWMKSNQTYTRPTATTSDDTDNAEDTTTE